MNDIIRERYPFEPTKKIADDLGLSESSVYNRAWSMGIKKDPVYLRSTQYPPVGNCFPLEDKECNFLCLTFQYLLFHLGLFV